MTSVQLERHHNFFIHIPGITKPLLSWHEQVISTTSHFYNSADTLSETIKKIIVLTSSIVLYPSLALLSLITFIHRTVKIICGSYEPQTAKDLFIQNLSYSQILTFFKNAPIPSIFLTKISFKTDKTLYYDLSASTIITPNDQHIDILNEGLKYMKDDCLHSLNYFSADQDLYILWENLLLYKSSDKFDSTSDIYYNSLSITKVFKCDETLTIVPNKTDHLSMTHIKEKFAQFDFSEVIDV